VCLTPTNDKDKDGKPVCLDASTQPICKTAPTAMPKDDKKKDKKDMKDKP
jgi:hypothetical protein